MDDVFALGPLREERLAVLDHSAGERVERADERGRAETVETRQMRLVVKVATVFRVGRAKRLEDGGLVSLGRQEVGHHVELEDVGRRLCHSLLYRLSTDFGRSAEVA